MSVNPFRDCVPKSSISQFTWKTYADLTADVRAWCKTLPEISAVCGIPRSGLIPASVIAQERHIPLIPLECLSGNMTHYRAEGGRKLRDLNGPILVVDDSVCKGDTIRQLKTFLSGRELLFGAVYARPESANMVDSFFENMGGGPRLFEWTFLRGSQSNQTLVDMDGVICDDWTVGPHAEHPGEYREHLENAKPLHLPAYPVAGIVTGRSEEFRAETEDWLNRHGVQYDTLHMASGKDVAHDKHAEFKAHKYANSPAILFIESSEWQSEVIAEITRKPVLSLETMTMYGG